MKPYYDHGGIRIFHGDCREILPTLETGSVDLVLTDPPYGVRWKSNRRKLAFEPITGDDSTDAAVEGIRLTLPCLKVHRHIYVFGRYNLSSLPLSSQVELIWDKATMNSGDLTLPWGNQHEYIQFAAYWPSKANREDGSGRLSARLRKGTVLRVLRSIDATLHPTEKPVQLLRELIESSSCIGETVLDPFAGSGSTLEAARIEGRHAIGIEIEEHYCEIIANRLNQGVLQFDA